VKEDGTELIQVQNNLLVFNWRKGQGNDYVGFNVIRQSLLEACDTLANFILAEGLGELRINQCELTYVNHLGFTNNRSSRRPLVEMFSCWNSPAGLPSMESPEEVNFQLQHVLTENDQSVGRLFVDLKSAYGNDGQMALYALNMIARGKPSDTGLPSAMAFLDRAHECLVRYFTDLTTPEMHLLWERN